MEDGDAVVAGLDTTTLAVRELISASRDLVARIARMMEMNANDMTAVSFLMDRGPLSVAEIADALGIRQPSATALADRLEASGRARRVRSADDRRRVLLTETPEARAAAYAAWLPGVLEIDALCRSLPDDERAVVRSFLARLTETMNDTARQHETGRPA